MSIKFFLLAIFDNFWMRFGEGGEIEFVLYMQFFLEIFGLNFVKNKILKNFLFFNF